MFMDEKVTKINEMNLTARHGSDTNLFRAVLIAPFTMKPR